LRGSDEADLSVVEFWLYRIAHGIAVYRIRRNASRERAEDVHTEAFEESEEPSFAEDDAAAIHRALEELAPNHREVLVLYFPEDFSLSEIAGPGTSA